MSHARQSLFYPLRNGPLLACLTGGGALLKERGVWLPESADNGQKPIFGITVADLARDGMLILTVLGRSASARLTIRGSWFARTAAADMVAATTTAASETVESSRATANAGGPKPNVRIHGWQTRY